MWSTRRCAGHAVPRDRASRAAGPFTAAPDSIQLEVVFLPISVLAVRKLTPSGMDRGRTWLAYAGVTHEFVVTPSQTITSRGLADPNRFDHDNWGP